MGTTGERLVAEYYGRVQTYVRMQVPEQDCEDVIGDVFLRAIEKQEQIKQDAGAWVFAVARNRIRDYYRQKGNAVNSRTRTNNGEMDRPAPGPQPIDGLEQGEFRQRLRDRLGRLSDVERDVIAFKFTDGLSNVEIARALDMPPSTLGVVLHRALGRLRKAMVEEA